MISNHQTIGDDVFFAAIEVAALALIVWCAWKWRRQEA